MLLQLYDVYFFSCIEDPTITQILKIEKMLCAKACKGDCSNLLNWREFSHLRMKWQKSGNRASGISVNEGPLVAGMVYKNPLNNVLKTKVNNTKYNPSELILFNCERGEKPGL